MYLLKLGSYAIIFSDCYYYSRFQSLVLNWRISSSLSKNWPHPCTRRSNKGWRTVFRQHLMITHQKESEKLGMVCKIRWLDQISVSYSCSSQEWYYIYLIRRLTSQYGWVFLQVGPKYNSMSKNTQPYWLVNRLIRCLLYDCFLLTFIKSLLFFIHTKIARFCLISWN